MCFSFALNPLVPMLGVENDNLLALDCFLELKVRASSGDCGCLALLLLGWLKHFLATLGVGEL